mgnify:CR=1 FL=1
MKQAAEDFGGEAVRVAEHFAQPVWKIEPALGYAETFSVEIEKASARVAGLESFEALKAKLPNIERLDLKEE